MTTITGLTASDVQTKRAQGDGNEVKLKTSRTYNQIIIKNVFNLVNTILFMIGGMLILMGRYNDAFSSAGLILVNAFVGTVQEIRAKRQLDKISLLTRPKVTVLRDGQEQSVDPAELVRGDILIARPGDQIVVDGAVVDGRMEADESALTGESDAILKNVGDEVLSGSFCVTGTVMYEAQKIGDESFANKLTATAREFKVHKTPLQKQVDLIIRLMAMVTIFFGYLLLINSQIYDIPFLRNIQLLAIITGLIPVGMFTMTVLSYALGAVKLISEGALTQESNAIESLSNVDVLCTDKTGTLTANRILYNDIYPIAHDMEVVKAMLADFAHSASVTNKTSEAIVNALPGQKRTPVDEVPFSSARKWSAISFGDGDHKGSYVMGALEMMRPDLGETTPEFDQQVKALSDQGLRVLTFAYNPDVTSLHDGEDPVLPPLQPLAIVTFTDELRAGVEETIAGFQKAGVQLKVISGDNPDTVAALAKQAGLGEDMKLVSGTELATMDDAAFDKAAEASTVFGRITPEQKERLVDSLKRQGHYVAMIGDGVNDVLSLKKADLGVAMESGSAAARGVAEIVLLKDTFGALVPAFFAGQSIVNGMRSIINLFLSRTLTVALIMVTSFILNIAAPFLPNNNALYASLTVGTPTVFLALWARPGKSGQPKLGEILRFAIPPAVLNVAIGTLIFAIAYFATVNNLATYNVTAEQMETMQEFVGFELGDADTVKTQVAGYVARSALTTFVVLTGILLIVFSNPKWSFFAVASELTDDIKPTLLAGAMAIGFVIIMSLEFTRNFFEMVVLRPIDYVLIVIAVIVWTFLLRYVQKIKLLDRIISDA